MNKYLECMYEWASEQHKNGDYCPFCDHARMAFLAAPATPYQFIGLGVCDYCPHRNYVENVLKKEYFNCLEAGRLVWSNYLGRG